MQNDEFELPDSSYSMSNIQDHIKCTIKNEILSSNPPNYIYINRINNRLAFKRKHRCKLELQTPETMKSFGTTKKINW